MIRPIEERTINDILDVQTRSVRKGGWEHQLAKVLDIPIGRLGAEELYLLLSRGVAQEYLLPRVLSVLESDPWQVVSFESGGLLEALIRTDPGHWPPGYEWRQRCHALLVLALKRAEQLFEFERNRALEQKLSDLLPSLYP